MTSSKSKPQNLWAKCLRSEFIPLLLRKTPQQDWTGDSLEKLTAWWWKLEKQTKHRPSWVTSLSGLPWILLSSAPVLPVSLLCFALPASSLSSPTWRKAACLDSLILCLLLTRREKRSCFQKMLPGAAEATAIRSGPDAQGWWLDNRAAWDTRGGFGRFPRAGTRAG